MKIKTCMLVAGHSALDDRIFYKESMTLYKAGYEVTEIAPLNRDGYIMAMGKKPIAQGETTINGIKIIGFKEGTHNIWGLPKTWTLSQCLRLAYNGKLNLGQDPYSELIEKGIEINADIYHCHEIASLYAGLKIKHELQKQGKNPKLIYDVHEYWASKRNKKLSQKLWSMSLKRFEEAAFRNVDYFITVNQIIRSDILMRSGFIKTEVLYNSPALYIFKDSERKADDSKVIICHEGSLTFDRGLKEMIKVIERLKERHSNFRFLIVGDVFGKEREYLEKEAKACGIDDIIERTGWLPYENVGEAIANCSIGIIFMDPNSSENISFSSPNKLFNYMRYGLPVVTVDLPEIRRIVLESQCGIVAKKRTVDALTNILSMLIDDNGLRQKLGENGKKAIIEKYGWEAMEKKLLRVYNEIVSDTEYIM